MASTSTYRSIIETVLQAYTTIPYAYGHVQTETIFDRDRDQYVLLTVGWDRDLRIHTVLVHIHLRGDKVWIEHDNTEDGIVVELEAAGIPKEHMVLGFRPANLRPYTAYAVA